MINEETMSIEHILQSGDVRSAVRTCLDTVRKSDPDKVVALISQMEISSEPMAAIILGNPEFKSGLFREFPRSILSYPGIHLSAEDFADVIEVCSRAGGTDSLDLLKAYADWQNGGSYPRKSVFDTAEVEDALEAAENESVTAYVANGLRCKCLVIHGYDSLAVISHGKNQGKDCWYLSESSSANLISGGDALHFLDQFEHFGEAFAAGLDHVGEFVPGYNAEEEAIVQQP